MYKENKNPYKKYLFNFSSSYSGGGLKRLMSYIEWFNKKGGAHFIVNDKLNGKLDGFSKNRFHYVSLTRFQKLINTQRYVDDVIKEMHKCDIYYSYNIPLKQNGAKIKWFHLSNVLPFTSMSKFNIPLRRRIELSWLGILTKRGLRYSDFISAESEYSLKLLSLDNNMKSLVSVNGSDQEIDLITSHSSSSANNNIAVIVGTYHHKNIIDSYKIYKHLKADNRDLKLIIIGDIDTVPQFIRDNPQTVLKGVIHHDETIKILANAAFYINTSQIENSWNAASEGVFLAKESFISNIPPHCELLKDSSIKIIDHLGTLLPIMHVSRDELNRDRLKTWDDTIITMDEFIKKKLSD